MLAVFEHRKARSGHHKAMTAAVAWLRSVGIVVHDDRPQPPGCFFPGVWYDGDAICYNPRVAHVGDLMHDAGHMAVLPAVLRRHLGVGCVFGGRNFKAVQAELLDNAFYAQAMLEATEWGDDVNAILHSNEAEATAWSYAAAMAAGIDPCRVLDAVAFFAQGNPMPIPGGGVRERVLLDERRHPGIAGLAHAGMCVRSEFPRMNRWLQK